MSGVIGTPRRRVDGRAKVTGQTRFADDVMLPRMAHCKLLRSTVPHARIVRIDTARAAAHPGVLLVLTGDSFPISYGVLPVSHDEHANPSREEIKEALSGCLCRCTGYQQIFEAVEAAVVAGSAKASNTRSAKAPAGRSIP